MIIRFLFISTLLLSSCFFNEDRVAGGEDFPNTLGAIVASGLEENKDWNKLEEVPTKVPNQKSNPALLKKSSSTLRSLLLKSAAPAPLGYDSIASQIVGDTVYLYLWRTVDSIKFQDTIVQLNDTLFKDTIKDNENIVRITSAGRKASSGKLFKYIHAKDGDGDGILTPQAGRTNRSKTRLVDYGDSTIQDINIIIDAGDDLDFDKEGDNKIISIYSLTSLYNGDTLIYEAVEDGDGDEVALDPTKNSQTVTITKISRGEPNSNQHITMVLFPQDSTKNYPIKFSEKKWWNNGRRSNGTIYGHQPDSTFLAADTFFAVTETYGLDTDTLSQSIVRVVGDLGSNPSTESDNRLFSIYSSAAYNMGEQKYAEFSLQPQSPLVSGQEILEGKLSALIVLTPSDTFRIQGRFFEDKISVEITLPTGEKASANWDRKGNDLIY